MKRVRLGWMREWPDASLDLPSEIIHLKAHKGRLYALCIDGTGWQIYLFWRVLVAVRCFE